MSRINLNPEQLAIWQREDLEHKRYEYDITAADVIVDLGAYRGEWTRKMFDRYGMKALCIEPTEAIHGFEYAEVINKAAGSHNGKVSMGGAYYYTSAFEDGNREVECIDVAALLLTIPEVAVLKVNIEGSEYEILNHIIDSGLASRIKNFQVQFHIIEGYPYEVWYKEIEKKLLRTHKLSWRYPFVWENWVRK